MKSVALALLIAGGVAGADAATLYSCPFQESYGDKIGRGFYVQHYPGATLDTVTLNYGPGSGAGTYTVSLTARIDSYDGPVVGTTQTRSLTFADGTAQKVEFGFGNAAVVPGSTVTFSQESVSGPAGGSLMFYDTGIGPCPNVVQTDGTNAPLDEVRRDSVGVLITGELAPANYQGTWWNSPAGSESGWGINFSHQGDTLFASWFTFDVDGSPLWMVAAAAKVAPGVYTGALYRGTGPAFDSVPFDPAKVVAIPAGAVTFAFADGNNGTFDYTVGAVTQSKNITRQVFASPVPICSWGTQPDLARATNYQDTWWAAPAGSESGWGINFAHQGDTIFATWFTFGRDGKPLWLVFAATKTAPGVYGGKLYTGTGPAFSQVPFDSSKVVPVEVGTATLTFADGNNAAFAYEYSGVAQTKAITREVFGPPGTTCR